MTKPHRNPGLPAKVCAVIEAKWCSLRYSYCDLFSTTVTAAKITEQSSNPSSTNWLLLLNIGHKLYEPWICVCVCRNSLSHLDIRGFYRHVPRVFSSCAALQGLCCRCSLHGLLHSCFENFFASYLCMTDCCKLHEGMPIEVIKEQKAGDI